MQLCMLKQHEQPNLFELTLVFCQLLLAAPFVPPSLLFGAVLADANKDRASRKQGLDNASYF